MIILFTLISAIFLTAAYAQSFVTVSTTSGRLQGVEQDGVMSFKGVRFGQPPTGLLRWEPPLPFVSAATQNATVLSPSCVQQFAFATASFIESLFNNPPVPEDEDCLFLNVWAPSTSGSSQAALKPVVFWIYGGSLAFGTGSLLQYDGTSITSNQGIVVVTFNYRTNIFGFPGTPDLPIQANNLGFLDQELALKWVQLNIRQFGGDPEKITIMGQSAGAVSVSGLVVRHPVDPPFRAAILFSGATPDSAPSLTEFDSFNAFSTAVGCTQAPGLARLACLKAISTATIRAYTNGPLSGAFGAVIDNVTTFGDNLERIRAGNAARVPVLAGNMQNDGTLFTVGETNLTAFLDASGLGSFVSADLVRTLYPGQNDTDVIADADRDLVFLCPASLWTEAFVQSGISSVYRYEYGAVFPDLQVFPNAGAWHSTELPELFGTFNASTATPNEVTLSQTFQTAIANFVKNPNQSPAPNWPEYIPGNNTQTLARLAYNGNVDTGNFVQAVTSDSEDAPCAVWNAFLDF
ncbi:Alpha/Beta hydrolase protein [Rhodocollybia butyracea]|uniref:Carboxylic ester hydrolase n=1 Tax=Rhodocollybia butyracea TaxID=206335 RepID=A0A9P5PH19_9AGAR|nr:Alpha/Beta hydrolase protein [Rhodocollybia butyracea]